MGLVESREATPVHTAATASFHPEWLLLLASMASRPLPRLDDETNPEYALRNERHQAQALEDRVQLQQEARDHGETLIPFTRAPREVTSEIAVDFTQMASFVPAQKLFADGLHLVCGYLPLRETAATWTTCRAFYIASRRAPIASRVRNLRCTGESGALALLGLTASPHRHLVRHLVLGDAWRMPKEVLARLPSIEGLEELVLRDVPPIAVPVVPRKWPWIPRAGACHPPLVAPASSATVPLPQSLKHLRLAWSSPQDIREIPKTHRRKTSRSLSGDYYAHVELTMLRCLRPSLDGVSALPQLRTLSLEWMDCSGAESRSLDLSAVVAVAPTLQSFTLLLPATELSDPQLDVLAKLSNLTRLRVTLGAHGRVPMSWTAHAFERVFGTKTSPRGIQELDLSRTSIEAALEPLLGRYLPQLHEVNLHDIPSRAAECTALVGMVQLRKATISFPFSKWAVPAAFSPALSACVTLRDLRIRNTAFTSDLLTSALRSMTHLERLDLQLVDLDSLACFSELPMLVTSLLHLALHLPYRVLESREGNHLVALERLEVLNMRVRFNPPVEGDSEVARDFFTHSKYQADTQVEPASPFGRHFPRLISSGIMSPASSSLSPSTQALARVARKLSIKAPVSMTAAWATFPLASAMDE